MMVDLKPTGMVDWLKDVLKMSVRIPTSWSAHSLSIRPGILSGPAALHVLSLDRVLFTSAVDRQSTCLLEGGIVFLISSLFCASNHMEKSNFST